jgi:hypothetical protein
MGVNVRAIEERFDLDERQAAAKAELARALPGIVRELRGSKTQAEFAVELGVATLTVSHMENGRGVAVGRPVLRKLLEMSKEC